MTEADHFREREHMRYSTPRDWLAVCFRQRRLVILCFGGVLAGSLLCAWFWAARYYEASMQILVMPDQADSNVSAQPTNGAQSGKFVSPGQLNSEVALLQGTDLLRQVGTTCKLNERGSITDIFLPRNQAARAQAKTERQPGDWSNRFAWERRNKRR